MIAAPLGSAPATIPGVRMMPCPTTPPTTTASPNPTPRMRSSSPPASAGVSGAAAGACSAVGAAAAVVAAAAAAAAGTAFRMAPSPRKSPMPAAGKYHDMGRADSPAACWRSCGRPNRNWCRPNRNWCRPQRNGGRHCCQPPLRRAKDLPVFGLPWSRPERFGTPLLDPGSPAQASHPILQLPLARSPADLPDCAARRFAGLSTPAWPRNSSPN